MVTDELEIESNTTTNSTIAQNINYEECCIFGNETVHQYGPTTHCEFLHIDSLRDMFFLIK